VGAAQQADVLDDVRPAVAEREPVMELEAVAGCAAPALVVDVPAALAVARAHGAVTAASMTAARWPSGTVERISPWRRSSLSRSRALAVNCTL
jgi:hypothetical protein